MRTFLAVICFGIGVAFTFGAFSSMLMGTWGRGPGWVAGWMLAGMFLLGGFALLRRRP